ncbi:MAG: EamA family transporter [Verrucomicrobiales bacterium]
MIWSLLFIGSVVSIQMLGQVFLKRGLNELEVEPLHGFRDIYGFTKRVFGNRFVKLALALWATWYVLYMTVLHHFDISKSYPLNSIDLLLILVVSRFYLKETIPWPRWLGACVIAVGVYLVAST